MSSKRKDAFSDTVFAASDMYFARNPVRRAKIASSPAAARTAAVGKSYAPPMSSPYFSHSAEIIFFILGMLLF